jgi:hypothetical protein
MVIYKDREIFERGSAAIFTSSWKTRHPVND